jgi:hypothetical protein
VPGTADKDQSFYLAMFCGKQRCITVFVEDCQCYGEGVNAGDPRGIKNDFPRGSNFPLRHVIA